MGGRFPRDFRAFGAPPAFKFPINKGKMVWNSIFGPLLLARGGCNPEPSAVATPLRQDFSLPFSRSFDVRFGNDSSTPLFELLIMKRCQRDREERKREEKERIETAADLFLFLLVWTFQCLARFICITSIQLPRELGKFWLNHIKYRMPSYFFK